MRGNTFVALLWLLVTASTNTSTTTILKQMGTDSDILFTLSSKSGGGEKEEETTVGEEVGQLVRQIVQRETLRDCHFVLLGGQDSLVISDIIKSLNADGGMLPGVVVTVGEDGAQEEHLGETGDPLLPGLLQGDVRFSCRAMVVDLTQANDLQQSIFRFLERIELYKWPETYIVAVGDKHDVKRHLSHHAFHNSANILYLAPSSTPLGEALLQDPLDPEGRASGAASGGQSGSLLESLMVPHEEEGTAMGSGGLAVYLYSRCLYCDSGEPRVYLLFTWTSRQGVLPSHAQLFPDQFRDLEGHRFRVVTMNWFPYIDFQRETEAGGSVVTPKDSLDYRMLQTIASHLNFTYEMRVPWDNQWGTSTPGGNWTGIVGTLQHHKADFSMMLSWMENRLPVVDYSRIYTSEPLVMITSKPLPLSQAFALVRPFTGQLWLVTLVSAVLAGALLFWLQWVWSLASGRRALGLGQAMMLTWGILLEDPPPRLPKNITAQMVLGWWWVYCMLLTIVYRSSLIAHLTFPGKSDTLESLEDLLKAHRREHWTWGYEPTYGSGWEWLKINDNPTVKQVFNNLMVVELDEQLERVLAGHHAFITWKYYIRSIIASQYTSASGYTPIHTAREEFFNYGGYGWGFRKGAPFRRRIDDLKQRLVQSGCVGFWLDELILTSGWQARITRNRKKKEEEKRGEDNDDEAKRETGRMEGSRNEVVLRLAHLQGIFYILGMGYAFALVAFVGEVLAHRWYPPRPPTTPNPARPKPTVRHTPGFD